jgi:hypothetical protein
MTAARNSSLVAEMPGTADTTGGFSFVPRPVRSAEEHPETPGTTRPRPRTIDLQGVLENVADQMRADGWEVSVVCPAIRLSVDPLRLLSVVIGAVGAAVLRGAEHTGIVVEVIDDEVVMMSIGDDGAPLEDHPGTDVRQLEEKTRQAFAGASVTTVWTRHEGVTMFCISAYRGALERLAPVEA